MLYINVKEASGLLGCSTRSVQLKIRSGILKPINPNHKTGYLFEKDYIEDLVNKEMEVSNV